jgi:hypothetical protein
MALISTRVFLRGHGGEPPSENAFFEQIDVQPRDGFKTLPSDSPWKAALITLVEVAIDDCLNAQEPHDEFAARIDAGLKRAAQWLMDGREQLLERWRAGGQKADIFVSGWLEEDQFDLVFRPEFLLACGRLGLQITICTND